MQLFSIMFDFDLGQKLELYHGVANIEAMIATMPNTFHMHLVF